jgi:predicted nucleic acid-binding protein
VTAYLDSSVILRRLLGQPGGLHEWRLIRTGVSSRLTEVECLRTIDRLRLEQAIDEKKLTILREALYSVLATLEIVEVTREFSRVLPTRRRRLSARWTRFIWLLLSSGENVLAELWPWPLMTALWLREHVPTDFALSG